jgi:hypothetical protein
MYNTGTLSYDASNVGQLFSITDSLTGSIFSVGDITGIPSIEVFDTGEVRLAEFSGNVGIGIANATSKLHVSGSANISGSLKVGSDTVIEANSVWVGPIIPAGKANVSISANSGTAIVGSGINFVNTATVSISVVSGASGLANVSFTAAAAGANGAQGAQGATGAQGPAGALSYTTVFGDGSNTNYSFDHNLNSNSFIGEVRRVSTGLIVYPDITIVNANTANVTFTIAPTTNEYRLSLIAF